MTMTAGTVGALNGGAPLAYLSQSVGWRSALLALCGLGLVVFFVNYFFLKASPRQEGVTVKPQLKELAAQLKGLFMNVHVLIIALAAVGCYLAISVLADLWGVSYMMQFYKIDKSTAAQCTSLLYVGLCIGALVIPWWSDKTHQRKKMIIYGLMVNVVCLVIFLYIPQLPLEGACFLLFLMGFCTGAEMVCFAYATEIVPPAMMGTVTGYINGLVTLGGAFLQQKVGKVLDEVWCGQCTVEGLRFYSVAEYRQALSMSIVVIVVTIIITLFLKEKKGRTL